VWHKFIKWLFAVPEGRRSIGAVVLWWEVRRIPYNLIVGIVGFCSLLMFYYFIIGAGILEPGEDAVEPIAILFAPILINILYTTGWIVEIIIRPFLPSHTWSIGPKLLKIGLIFSLVIVLIPSTYWGVYRALQFGGLIK
jgi:hypothetical protein